MSWANSWTSRPGCVSCLQAEKRDPSAIGKQTMKMAELRRQLVEASVDAHNRMEALLTKEQKEQLRSFRHGWMMGDD